MSYTYTVYAHEQRGQWGFTAQTHDGAVHTAAIDRDGAVTLSRLDPLKVAPEMQRRLRSGFQKEAQPKYLHLRLDNGVQRGEFVTQHPDLAQAMAGALVFFVAVPPGIDMKQASDEWRERLEGQFSYSAARQEWLAHCERTSAYVPVNDQDPHAALLVAQWARENNLVLVPRSGEAPVGTPQAQRYEWRTFLSNWFDQKDVDRALTDLGWSLVEAMNVAPAASISTLPAGDPEWLALAQQASF